MAMGEPSPEGRLTRVDLRSIMVQTLMEDILSNLRCFSIVFNVLILMNIRKNHPSIPGKFRTAASQG